MIVVGEEVVRIVPYKVTYIPTHISQYSHRYLHTYFTRSYTRKKPTQYLHTNSHSSYIQITYTLHNSEREKRNLNKKKVNDLKKERINWKSILQNGVDKI